jgi:hypothetical protein
VLGALQVALALALTAPLVAEVSQFAGRPTASGAVGIVEVSAIWALAALTVWMLRVAALSGAGRWGEATRRRVRNRRRGVDARR